MSKGSRWTKFVGEKKGYTSYDTDLLSHNHSIIYINHFINYYVQIALHKLHSPPLLFNFHLKVCVCVYCTVYSTVYSTQTDRKNRLKLNEYLLTGWSDIIRLSLHPHQRVCIAISIFDNFFLTVQTAIFIMVFWASSWTKDRLTCPSRPGFLHQVKFT